MANSIDTSQVPEQTPFSIDTQTLSGPIPDNIAVPRAKKAFMGLGSVTGDSFEEMYSQISGGQEQMLRAKAAAALDAQNADKMRQRTVDMLSGGKVDPKDLPALMQANQMAKVDPGTVIEQGYGKAVMNQYDLTKDTLGGSYKQAFETVPELTHATNDAAAIHIAKHDYVLNTYLNGEKDRQQESWPAWGWDSFKNWFVPGYGQTVERAIEPGGFFEGGAYVGEHRFASTRHIWAKPLPGFKEDFDTTYNNLKNQSLTIAQEYAKSMLGMSTTDVANANISGLMDLAFTGQALKGLGSGTVKLATALKGARQGALDVAREAGHVDASPASIANAAGDAEMSSLHQTTSELKQEAAGNLDFTKKFYDSITSDGKSWIEQQRQNAGRFGQEGVNRFWEQRQKFEEWFNKKYGNLFKVDRIPELQTELGLKAFNENFLKDQYGFLSDSVMDKKIYREPFTNTNWGELQVGTPQGEFFTSAEGASNYAAQHGMDHIFSDKALDDLNLRIAQLQEDFKVIDPQTADTAGLNKYFEKEQQLKDLETRRDGMKFQNRGDTWMVKQQGQGYYLSLVKPINEEEAWVRNIMAKTKFDKIFNPKSFIKTQLNRFRTPEEVNAEAENQQRKFATFVPQLLKVMAGESSKALEQVPRKFQDEFYQALDYGRKAFDPKDNLRGYFFSSPKELEDFYVSHFNRVPEASETEAYMTYVRNYELKRVIQSAQLFKFKARLGAEQHSFTMGDAKSPFFDGVKQPQWPGSSPDRVAIVMPDGKVNVPMSNQMISGPLYKMLKEGVEKGEWSVLRIFDPDKFPLKDFLGTDKRVRYVLTKNVESKPLDLMSQIDKRGGGHFIYDYDHYLKQPKFHTDGGYKTYLGDITAAAIPIRSLGKEMESRWNAVRDLIAQKKLTEAAKLHNDTMPGDLKFETFKGWFDPARDASGKISGGPRFDVNEPFRLVEKNTTLGKLYKDQFSNRFGEGKYRDGTISGSDARQYQVAYTQARDAHDLGAITDSGSPGNPVYKYEPAALVDPLTTYERSWKMLAQSAVMDDMKLYSYKHWLEQAIPLLQGPKAQLERTFYRTFHNPPWRGDLTAEEKLFQQNLMSARDRINTFTGHLSKTEMQLFSWKQNVLDMMYERGGAKPANLTDKALSSTRDPAAFIRSAVSHQFLGLFNLHSLYTQASTLANVMFISPRSAMSSVAAGFIHGLTRINANPEIIQGLDAMLSKLQFPGMRGFRPGEFGEAWDALHNRAGFDRLGHEQIFLDDPMGTKIIQGVWSKTLDYGMLPFKMGAGMVRTSAWYAAYLEHRELVGVRSLTDSDWAKIINRASDLDHNMSRASTTPTLQTGVLSITNQFQSYALRLSELMTGKRLTAGEKVRLFTASSMLYGIPGGGIGLFFYPMGDSIRQSLLSGEGFGPYGVIPNPFPQYIPGENPYYTGANEGILAAALQWMTSDGDFRTGTQANFRKFGPEQYQMLDEFLKNEGILKVLAGAAGGGLAKIFAAGRPFWNWAVSVLDPNFKYTVHTQDILKGLANTTSAGSSYERMFESLHTHRVLSQTGRYLNDVSTGEALMQGIVGTGTYGNADITNKEAVLGWRGDKDRETLRLAGEEVSKALRAEHDGDPQQMREYYDNASAIFLRRGYPEEKMIRGMKMLLDNFTSLDKRLDFNMNVQSLPLSRRPEGREVYKREQEMRQLRKKGRE